MTAAVALALALSQVIPLPVPGRAGRAEPAADARPLRPADVASRSRAALELLAEEDVEGARAIVDPLLAAHPEARPVRLAAGVLRFYEQRYDEAVSLLERSGAADDAGGFLGLARAARDAVKDDARLESDHFVIFTPKGKDEVLAPYAAETLEAQRAALEKDLGWAPPGKVTVEFLSSPKDLARLSTLTEQEIRTSGTIALCKFNKLMVVSPKALLKGYDWLDTVAHEYTHHVITGKTRDRTPIWLHEGIAKWSETRWRGAGGASFTPYASALLRDALRRNSLVTFAQMHPSMAKLPSQEAAALAFAEVETVVEFLVQRGGTPMVARALDLIAAGRTAEAAVAEALGLSVERFLADWRRFMAARPVPRGGEHELKKLRFKDDPKHEGEWSEWAEVPDARARGWARLGEIYRERGKWTAARVEYAKAVQRVGTRVPILADQYAIAAMMSGRDADAERTLAESIQWNPDHAALHVHLARLLLKRKDLAGARQHLDVANRQDPLDPEIHAGLAIALDGLGDPGAASRERRFAELLAHGDAR